MVVQAYILIQTDVGKAAEVAREIAQVKGVTLAEDVTGPYDVIVRAEARNVDELGKLVVSEGAEPRRHHPHPDLPGRAHLTGCDASRRPVPDGTGASSRVACSLLPAPAAASEPVSIDVARRWSAADGAACEALARRPARRAGRRGAPDGRPATAALGAAVG